MRCQICDFSNTAPSDFHLGAVLDHRADNHVQVIKDEFICLECEDAIIKATKPQIIDEQNVIFLEDDNDELGIRDDPEGIPAYSLSMRG